MKLVSMILGRLFCELDRPILQLQEIRDSYRLLNVDARRLPAF